VYPTGAETVFDAALSPDQADVGFCAVDSEATAPPVTGKTVPPEEVEAFAGQMSDGAARR